MILVRCRQICRGDRDRGRGAGGGVVEARGSCCVCVLFVMHPSRQSLGGEGEAGVMTAELELFSTASLHAQRHAGVGVVEVDVAVDAVGLANDGTATKRVEPAAASDANLPAGCGCGAAMFLHVMMGCEACSADAAASTS